MKSSVYLQSRKFMPFLETRVDANLRIITLCYQKIKSFEEDIDPHSLCHIFMFHIWLMVCFKYLAAHLNLHIHANMA